MRRSEGMTIAAPTSVQSPPTLLITKPHRHRLRPKPAGPDPAPADQGLNGRRRVHCPQGSAYPGGPTPASRSAGRRAAPVPPRPSALPLLYHLESGSSSYFGEEAEAGRAQGPRDSHTLRDVSLRNVNWAGRTALADRHHQHPGCRLRRDGRTVSLPHSRPPCHARAPCRSGSPCAAVRGEDLRTVHPVRPASPRLPWRRQPQSQPPPPLRAVDRIAIHRCDTRLARTQHPGVQWG